MKSRKFGPHFFLLVLVLLAATAFFTWMLFDMANQVDCGRRLAACWLVWATVALPSAVFIFIVVNLVRRQGDNTY